MKILLSYFLPLVGLCGRCSILVMVLLDCLLAAGRNWGYIEDIIDKMEWIYTF